MSGVHIRFNDDDDNDDYQPSDSDDEYTSKEKELLRKATNKTKDFSDSEDEVYAVGSDSDEELANSDIAVSDVEGQEDDDLPDVRAWGKDKRKYYATDYVDPDYGGFQGNDATLAELEEEEARSLQKQLVQQLDDDDFNLDIFVTSQDESKKESEELIKTDISKLSKRQQIQIFEKESPEFFGLVEDFKAKMSLAKEFLSPVIQLFKDGKIKESKALDFVKIQHQLILNYCTNIQMYLLLKASKVNIKNHPIAKRLYQYRQLLSQFDSTFDDIIKPQIEVLLEEHKNDNSNQENTKKKKLNILKNLSKNTVSIKKDSEDVPPEKKVKKLEDKSVKSKTVAFEHVDSSESDSDDNEKKEGEVEENAENNNEDGDAKRGITYQIAKNKGLTPHRKKELRNPRVKHRNKFRKAKIRRKGAVREVRKELSRYAGEVSGIKTSVTKSIKIKS